MHRQKKTGYDKRINRVRWLKRIIVVSIVAGILIPTILCLMLMVKVSDMEQRLQQLYDVSVLDQQKELSIEEQNRLTREEKDQEIQEVLAGSENELEGLLIEKTVRDMIPASTETEDRQNQQDSGTTAEDKIRSVYLTFDDGPSIYTDEILDILAEHHVKATFFVNGREDERSIAMYQRIVAEGHTLGMHSYSHQYTQVYASKDAFIADTLRLQQYLQKVTGVKSVIYRFPGGSSNHVSSVRMEELIDWLDEQGIAFFDWNISSGDASSGSLSVQQILDNSTRKIDSHEEPVILMHDSGAKKTTVEALPLVIEKLQAMDDVQIVPITDETQPVHHIR